MNISAKSEYVRTKHIYKMFNLNSMQCSFCLTICYKVIYENCKLICRYIGFDLESVIPSFIHNGYFVLRGCKIAAYCLWNAAGCPLPSCAL